VPELQIANSLVAKELSDVPYKVTCDEVTFRNMTLPAVRLPLRGHDAAPTGKSADLKESS
jgi:hypothetical protein